MKHLVFTLHYVIGAYWVIALMALTVTLPSVAYGDSISAALADRAKPLHTEDDLTPLIERAATHPYVLLGEASHGTAEFYTWRAEISKRLIKEHGFSFIAVEGDWDACWALNKYVKNLPGAAENAEAVLRSFNRWPLWMWANRQVEDLAEWMRAYNQDSPRKEQAGFYGIDVYGLEGSMQETRAYFEQMDDQEAYAAVQSAYDCLESQMPPQQYARAVMVGLDPCNGPIADVVQYLREHEARLRSEDAKAWFNAKQHALVVKNAEKHYRAMASPGGESWNLRVAHFHETVERLMDYHGEGARGIVWAHNTHIGDARATTMAQAGRHNIGQLLREKHGDEAVFAVGFGTHRGIVLAGSAWEAPMERMIVPHAKPDSLEDMLNAIGLPRLVLLFDPEDREGILRQPVDHRAIGVVYDPGRERLGNYVATVMPQRYDAFIFISETTALTPLHP